MADRAILFIESNTSGTGKLFIETAMTLGFVPLIFTTQPSKYTFKDEIGNWFLITSHDEKHILARIDELENQYRVAAVTSSSDFYIHLASRIATLKHLRGPIPDTIALCRNKYEVRKLTHRHGFHTPRFLLMTSEDATFEAITHVGFPMIVKPVSGSGSSQVMLCKNLDDLQAYVSKIFSIEVRDRQVLQVLAESYVEGQEFSAEIFNGDVVGITKKHIGNPPFFVECGHDFPYHAPNEEQLTIERELKKLVAAIGMNFGPYHVEFRMHEGQFWLIEINPRLAGGFIPVIVNNALGIDLIKATLENLLSDSPSILQATSEQYSSIRFIIPPNSGTLNRIVLPEGKHYQHAIYKPLPFEIAQIFGDFRDRIGHVITEGDSFPASTGSADEIVARVQLTFAE